MEIRLYRTSVSLVEQNSAANQDCDSNIQQYRKGRHIDTSENRKYDNTVCNPDINAEYSYACPDGITKNAGQREKSNSPDASHYSSTNCGSESDNP